MKCQILLGLCACLLAGCGAPTDKSTVQREKAAVSPEKDEQSIREYYGKWMKATQEGDLALAKSLIADDAVFLVPHAGRMDKDSFAAAATATDPNADFKLDSSIKEIKVLGDHAWLWTEVKLEIIDKATKTTTKWVGQTLSILERRDETWVVIRDVNTLLPVAEPGQ